jgi:hypothetical protein
VLSSGAWEAGWNEYVGDNSSCRNCATRTGNFVGRINLRRHEHHRRNHGLKPAPLLQGIAAGVLGPRAFQGGASTALLGLACHFTVAFLAAATFVEITRLWDFPVRHFVVAGVLYGPIVYFFMQLVVLPLSNARHFPFSIKMMVIGLIIHIFCVGLPIAIAARKFSGIS